MAKVKEALTKYAPTRGFAQILGLGLLVWGVWVLLPFTAFTGPVYSFMTSLAVEGVWGALFVFGGLTLCGGTWWKNLDWIAKGAFLGFALWTTIAILGFIAEPSATPVVTRGIIALLHGWLYLQIHVHPELVTGAVTIDDLRKFKETRESGEN